MELGRLIEKVFVFLAFRSDVRTPSDLQRDAVFLFFALFSLEDVKLAAQLLALENLEQTLRAPTR